MPLWPEEYEALRAEARALAPLVVDALALPAIDGDRDARTAQRRAALQQHMIASPDGVDDCVAVAAALLADTDLPLLIDDSLFMAARWSAFGNEGELAVYPDGIHAFVGFPMALADRARERIDEFLARCLK